MNKISKQSQEGTFVTFAKQCIHQARTMAHERPSMTVSSSLTTSDPEKCPVLIIGQVAHLQSISFSQVSCKLEPRVQELDWNSIVSGLGSSTTDTCPLYRTSATVAALPLNCYRHNSPSRAYAISKVVKAKSTGKNQCIVLVCEKENVYASVCATARSFPLYSMKKFTSEVESVKIEIVLVGEDVSPLTASNVKALEDVCESIRLAARIVDTPANEMHVDQFIKEIEIVGKSLNLVPTIIRGEELAQRGMGGIYGVGKAALLPPALVILSHTPPGAVENIAWVGKGIIFDTGGLSIKPKTGMPGMKRDCGGAAAVLGAFYSAVSAGFSQNLHAIFCLAENAVGPKATRPDDIHTLYSGRTVEINNTDAEGRLVLSDGVVYAAVDLQCTTIVDIATLTGAQGVATGKYHGALLTNEESWEKVGVRSGRASGDLVQPIVYTPDLHFSEFASAVADMKNSVADRSNATSSCAGLFIGCHLGFDFPGSWVHIDMASPSHCGDRATGYGVALLQTMFSHLCTEPLIKSLALYESEASVPPKKIKMDM